MIVYDNIHKKRRGGVRDDSVIHINYTRRKLMRVIREIQMRCSNASKFRKNNNYSAGNKQKGNG